MTEHGWFVTKQVEGDSYWRYVGRCQCGWASRPLVTEKAAAEAAIGHIRHGPGGSQTDESQ